MDCVAGVESGWDEVLTDWQIGVVLTRRPRLIEALKLNGRKQRAQSGEIVVLERN